MTHHHLQNTEIDGGNWLGYILEDESECCLKSFRHAYLDLLYLFLFKKKIPF